MGGTSIERLLARLGLTFRDPSLLMVALTHRSIVNESPEPTLPDNERLEFLGDAILGAVVADELYRLFPDATEGSLTVMRAQLVREAGLARVARGLELGQFVILGRGEEQRGGRERDGLLASAFEAVIGAIHLDKGHAVSRRIILELMAEPLAELAGAAPLQDAKSDLQNRVQGRFHSLPSYRLVSAEGPEHRPVFTVEVTATGGIYGLGTGSSKRAAEQEAAQQALDSWTSERE